MGNDVSHFIISLIVRGKVTRQCPQTTTSEERGGHKRNETEVCLLSSLASYRGANTDRAPPNVLLTVTRHMYFDPPVVIRTEFRSLRPT